MKLKNIFTLVIGFFVIITLSSFGEETVSEKFPLAYISQADFHFDPIPEGKEVAHDFIVQNRGDSILVIENVQTG